jgi:hypothetical protein
VRLTKGLTEGLTESLTESLAVSLTESLTESFFDCEFDWEQAFARRVAFRTPSTATPRDKLAAFVENSRHFNQKSVEFASVYLQDQWETNLRGGLLLATGPGSDNGRLQRLLRDCDVDPEAEEAEIDLQQAYQYLLRITHVSYVAIHIVV